jgi:hypothetical protein
VQRHPAPEIDDDPTTVVFDRPKQPGEPVERLLAGWPGPSRRLSLRHWMGLGSLAIVILAAAFGLPPLVSSGADGPASPGFPAITVQAEAPGNHLSGGAQPVACPHCSGGARVQSMGRVDVHFTVPASGQRTVTLTYEVSGRRTVDISVDGGAPMVTSLTGNGWDSPSTRTFLVTIPAGEATLGFYNPDGPGPDIDAVTVS